MFLISQIILAIFLIYQVSTDLVIDKKYFDVLSEIFYETRFSQTNITEIFRK